MAHSALRKLTSRSLPDLTCGHEEHGHLHDMPDDQGDEQHEASLLQHQLRHHHHHHHQLQQHHSLTTQDSGSSDSPVGLKKLQPHHLLRDNQKLSILSSAQFRPFFHSSSSSLSSESCHSHSLPPHNCAALLSKEALSSSGSKAPAEEDFESLKLISNGAYG